MSIGEKMNCAEDLISVFGIIELLQAKPNAIVELMCPLTNKICQFFLLTVYRYSSSFNYFSSILIFDQ